MRIARSGYLVLFTISFAALFVAFGTGTALADKGFQGFVYWSGTETPINGVTVSVNLKAPGLPVEGVTQSGVTPMSYSGLARNGQYYFSIPYVGRVAPDAILTASYQGQTQTYRISASESITRHNFYFRPASTPTPIPTPTPVPPKVTPVNITVNPGPPFSSPFPAPGNFSQACLIPVTTAVINGKTGNNGWYVTEVQVTLSVEDTGISGIESTMYKVENNQLSPLPLKEYDGSTITLTDGVHKLYYYSTSKAGAVEDVNVLEIKVDTTPPDITIISPVDGAWYNYTSDIVQAKYLIKDNFYLTSIFTSGIDESRTKVTHSIYLPIPHFFNDITIVYYLPLWSQTVQNGQFLDLTHHNATNSFTVIAYDNAGNRAVKEIDFKLYCFGSDGSGVNTDFEDGDDGSQDEIDMLIQILKTMSDSLWNSIRHFDG